MKLSVITIHLDQWESLRRTAESLKRFLDLAEVEWVVIDGQSRADSDSAVSIREEVRLSADRFISEKDDGIYNAMNKGTALASGSHLLYLNAGDELHPGFELTPFRNLTEGSNPGMLWGQSWDRDRNGDTYLRKSRPPSWLKFGIPVCHQAVIFRSDLLGKAPYRESLKIAGDYELLCRLHCEGAGVVMVDNPVVIFELTGLSSSRSELAMEEESMVRQEYFPKPAFIESGLSGFKHLLWKLSMQFPSSRKLWRRRI